MTDNSQFNRSFISSVRLGLGAMKKGLPLLLPAIILLWIFWELPAWRIYSSMGLLIIFVVVIWKVPQWQVSSLKGVIEPMDLADLEDKFRKTVTQILGGVAFLGGLYFTWMSVQVSQEGQITERFTRAIEQLGSTDQQGGKMMEIRLGGIYALKRIATDSDKDFGPVTEVLTAYIRANAPWKKYQAPEGNKDLESRSQPQKMLEQSQVKPSADIQTILTIICGPTWTLHKGKRQHLDLAETDLRGADLTGAHLEGANLVEAHMEGAILKGANLKEALLLRARLEDTDFEGANLKGAKLKGAHLERSTLIKARLDRAILWGAHLEHANLKDAVLVNSRLEGADFSKARLGGANLNGANLSRAGLWGANLERVTGLSQEQVASALSDGETKFPEYLKSQ